MSDWPAKLEQGKSYSIDFGRSWRGRTWTGTHNIKWVANIRQDFSPYFIVTLSPRFRWKWRARQWAESFIQGRDS